MRNDEDLILFIFIVCLLFISVTLLCYILFIPCNGDTFYVLFLLYSMVCTKPESICKLKKTSNITFIFLYNVRKQTCSTQVINAKMLLILHQHCIQQIRLNSVEVVHQMQWSHLVAASAGWKFFRSFTCLQKLMPCTDAPLLDEV